MISKAVSRYIRISPRKTRLVADMIRGKTIDQAHAILMTVNKRATLYIQEVLNSAIANATSNNPELALGDLYISKITIDGGPMFKRYRAGSMGRAMMIRHRTSHIAVELEKKHVKAKGQAQHAKGNVKEVKTKRPAAKDQKPEAVSAVKTKLKDKKAAAVKKGK